MEGQPEQRNGVRDLLLGQVLHDRYRVLRRLGRGGMGTVYLAQHVLIGREYAVKVMAERAPSDELLARFHREALAAAAVGSDHVVEVTDMGKLDDGCPFIVLEYLHGLDLAESVRREGPYSLPRALHVMDQLCDALCAVHDTGIVHRDLKPENVFLTTRHGHKDFVKVLDFGICKLLESDSSPDLSELAQQPLTRTNASLGTPQYMAPEQFKGSARVDRRADIHAAGAILFYLLSGRAPFNAETLQRLLMQICTEPPPSLREVRSDVPAALDGVLKRAMSKSPEDRYPNAAAFKEALGPFWHGRHGMHGKAIATQPQIADVPARAATEPAQLLRALPTQPSGDEAPDDDVEAEPLAPFLQRRGPWIVGGSLSLVGALVLAISLPTSPAERSPRPFRPVEPAPQQRRSPDAPAPDTGAPPPGPAAAGAAPAPGVPALRQPSEEGDDRPTGPAAVGQKPRPERRPRPPTHAFVPSDPAGVRPAAASADAGRAQPSEGTELAPQVSDGPEGSPAPPVDPPPPSYRFPRRQLKEVFPAP